MESRRSLHIDARHVQELGAHLAHCTGVQVLRGLQTAGGHQEIRQLHHAKGKVAKCFEGRGNVRIYAYDGDGVKVLHGGTRQVRQVEIEAEDTDILKEVTKQERHSLLYGKALGSLILENHCELLQFPSKMYEKHLDNTLPYVSFRTYYITLRFS